MRTGIATVCIVRVRLDSAPPGRRAVTSIEYGVTRPMNPWNGPDRISRTSEAGYG